MSNYSLTTCFEIEEELFHIHNKGDYRTVLSCFNILYDNELTEKERLYACLIVFYDELEDLDDIIENIHLVKELTEKMFWFFDCGNAYADTKPKPKLIDWDKDEILIVSAINNVAKQEIRALEYLHWWTFISYYMAIGDCSLSQIVAIRDKIARHKKLEKHEKKFKDENPQYFNFDYRTKADKDADDWIMSLWNGGNK